MIGPSTGDREGRRQVKLRGKINFFHTSEKNFVDSGVTSGKEGLD